MNTTSRAYAAIGGIIVIMVLVLSQPAAAQTGTVTAEAAAAVDTFYRLTECKAEFADTETYLLYSPDPQAALERAAVELTPKGYFVLIYGRVIERARWLLATPGPGQTLDDVTETADVPVEGIVGRVWVDIETGRPYHVAGANRPRAGLNCLAVMPGDALAQVQDHATGTITPPSLVEVEDYTFVWYFRDDQTAHYVDARTGEYLTEEALGARLQEIQQTLAAMPEDAGGVTHCSLSPVFIEQGIHQHQHETVFPGEDGLCGPTSLAMVFDYWGEEIDKLSVADVSTPFGGMTVVSDLCRAAMFSHNSDSRAAWDPPDWQDHWYDGPQQGGYDERPYGYTAAREESLDGDSAWSALVELIQERCPFVANIAPPNGNGHYLVVVGYALDGEDKWVSVSDPANDDLIWDDWDNRTWADFDSSWVNRSRRLMVFRPMPVEMTFVPDALEPGYFTIRATVRTCQPYPSSIPGGAWNRINQACELKGNADGTSENCPVTIEYPATVQKLSGSDTEDFNPVGTNAFHTFEWEFYDPPAGPKGGTFTVTVRGWATDINSTSYTDAKDELFGWGAIHVDGSLLRIRNANGDTVAAIGDQGNVYLASTLTDWCDSITATAEKELLVQSGGVNVARFAPSGTLEILRSCHGGMDDLHDAAWEVMPWTPWLLDEDITVGATELWYTPYGAAWDLLYDFPFYIRIHDEILKVTDFADEQPDGFTVVRAQEGTTARAYDATAAITLHGKAALKYAVASGTTTLTFDEAQARKFPLRYLSDPDFKLPSFGGGRPIEPLVVKIDDEILLVADICQDDETYTFTVVRGYAATEPAAHAAGSDVFLNLGEQFALSRVHGQWSDADNTAFKIRGPNGEVVAYIDSEGNLRHKGIVFENWTGWDYWD